VEKHLEKPCQRATKPKPRGIRKGVRGVAGRGKRPPSDEDEDPGSEDSSEEWSE
jgi:hypothetical protein